MKGCLRLWAWVYATLVAVGGANMRDHRVGDRQRCFAARNDMRRAPASNSLRVEHSLWNIRGGATRQGDSDQRHSLPALDLLAQAVRPLLMSDNDLPTAPSLADLRSAFGALSSSQQGLKNLDGAAHEAYQRTHHQADLLSVTGRAQRTVARLQAAALGLEAGELCELVEERDVAIDAGANGTLAKREVVLNATAAVSMTTPTGNENAISIDILVLYERDYNGGGGVQYGGLAVSGESSLSKGRLLVILGDQNASLGQILRCLAQSPNKRVRLPDGEVASVPQLLHTAAVELIQQQLEPLLRRTVADNRISNETAVSPLARPAVHIVGRSVAGGVASLVAAMLNGNLPLVSGKTKSITNKKRRRSTEAANTNTTEYSPTDQSLSKLCEGSVSCVVLGAPPCMSANVPTAEYQWAILYGDDIVPRSSYDSLQRLLQRTRKTLDQGLLGRQWGRMTGAWTLAAAGLVSHAHGSEGEESRLALPGRAFLVRPRRLGNVCSMHEIGTAQLKGGREALRAAVLWQLNDVLLTKSLWKHHQLDSYIHGIDRLQLRGLTDAGDDDTGTV